MDLETLIDSLSEDELRFIASADYGEETDIHLLELRKLIRDQRGILSKDQLWHPYEVIELRANALVRGHERVFAACTLIVIRAVASGYDRATVLDWKLSQHAADYDLLPLELRDLVLDAYVTAGLNLPGARATRP
jgi:hypothetical protein